MDVEAGREVRVSPMGDMRIGDWLVADDLDDLQRAVPWKLPDVITGWRLEVCDGLVEELGYRGEPERHSGTGPSHGRWPPGTRVRMLKA